MNRILKQIHADWAHNRGITGKDVHVAVLDTGAFPHLAIKDRIVYFKDYQSNKSSPYDDNGHGTHILGIIGGKLPQVGFYGVAPGCKFHVYKILNENGNGKIKILTDAIWDVIAQCKNHKIQIINISIGVSKELESTDIEMLDHAIDEAWKRGIIVVAAAGNNGPKNGSVTLPGVNQRVITVGCLDDRGGGISSGLKSGFSGIGPTKSCIVKPEILVPGINVRSCGNLAPQHFAIKSGTSMAAPVVTGMIALLLQNNPFLTPDEVKMKIYHSVIKLPMQDYCWGYLTVDRLLV